MGEDYGGFANTTSPSSASPAPRRPSSGSLTGRHVTLRADGNRADGLDSRPHLLRLTLSTEPAMSGGIRPSGRTRIFKTLDDKQKARAVVSRDRAPRGRRSRPLRRRSRRPAEGDGPATPRRPPHPFRSFADDSVPSSLRDRRIAPTHLFPGRRHRSLGTSGSSKARPSPGTSTARHTSTPGSTLAEICRRRDREPLFVKRPGAMCDAANDSPHRHDPVTRILLLRATHRIPAIKAAVAGPAADGQGTAVVAGGGVALEVGELLVADFERPLFGEVKGGRRAAATVPRTASACSRSAIVAERWPLTLTRGCSAPRARRKGAGGRWPRGSRG